MLLLRILFVLYAVMMDSSLLWASSSELIHIDYGGRKVAYKFNLSTPLSEVRAKLSNRMNTGDLFQVEDSEILPEYEKEFTIQDIVKDNIIKIKFNSLASSGVGIQTSEANNLPQNIKTTAHIINYSRISENEKTDLISRLGLFKALRLTEAGIEPTLKASIEWTNAPTWSNPSSFLQVEKSYSLSKLTHELSKKGIKAPQLGIESFSVISSAQRGNTEVYLLATYDIPKVKLSVPLEHITASQEFSKSIALAVYGSMAQGDFALAYVKLLEILSEYGFFVPTEFTLGGRIYTEEVKKLTTSSNLEKESATFALGLEASLKSSGYAVTSNDGLSPSRTQHIPRAPEVIRNPVLKQASGGDFSQVNNSVNWLTSLELANKWEVLGYGGLIPMIKFIDQPLQGQCIKLINQYCLSNLGSNYSKLINMKHYADELVKDSLDDF